MRESQIFDDAVKDQKRFGELYDRIVREQRRPANTSVRSVGFSLYPALGQFGKVEDTHRTDGPAEWHFWAKVLEAIEDQPTQRHGEYLVHSVMQELQNNMKHRQRAVQGKLTGRVKYFNEVLKAWGFSRDEASRMLGVSPGYLGGLFIDGKAPLLGGDMSERVGVVVAIAVALENLYDDDAVIKKWFDQRRSELGGKTPRELLAGGTLEGLFRVRDLVRYQANR